MLLGRGSDCALRLCREVEVSRVHLTFQETGEGWWVEDVGSSNGTELNGVRMTPHQRYPLTAGSWLVLSPPDGARCYIHEVPPRQMASPPASPDALHEDGPDHT